MGTVVIYIFKVTLLFYEQHKSNLKNYTIIRMIIFGYHSMSSMLKKF